MHYPQPRNTILASKQLNKSQLLTLLFSASSFVSRRHINDAIGVNVKRHFNLGYTTWGRWNTNLRRTKLFKDKINSEKVSKKKKAKTEVGWRIDDHCASLTSQGVYFRALPEGHPFSHRPRQIGLNQINIQKLVSPSDADNTQKQTFEIILYNTISCDQSFILRQSCHSKEEQARKIWAMRDTTRVPKIVTLRHRCARVHFACLQKLED